MIFSAKVANDHNRTNLLPIKKTYLRVFLVFVIIRESIVYVSARKKILTSPTERGGKDENRNYMF